MKLFFALVTVLLFFKSVEAAVQKEKLARQNEKVPINLQDILSNTLGAGGFGGNWIPGSNDTIRVISGNNVWEYNVATSNNKTVVESTIFEERFGLQALGLTFSADNQFILIEHSRRALWRHSYLAKYDVYNISGRNFTIVQPKGMEAVPQEFLQLVQWSTSGHSLAFIYNNDIYYKKSPQETTERITNDGGSDVFNGISDWVYEEEMFGSPVAMWFSKDSSNLAFVKFNDSQVPNYEWPLYGEPGVRETVYPIYEPLRYPKAGWNNPMVSLLIVNLTDPALRPTTIKYPAGQSEALQYYIANVNWASGTDLLVENFNRHQNQSVWNYCNANASCIEVYAQSNFVGWIDAKTPKISTDGSKFLLIEPIRQPVSGRSYEHIMSISIQTKQANPITAGEFHVDSILGWDESNNKIYFAGTGFHPNSSDSSDPSERHVYAVDASGTNTSPACISCGIKTGANEDCRSHSFTYSGNLEYYIHSCKGPGVPEISTKKSSDNSVVKVWNYNEALRLRLEGKLMPSIRELEVNVSGGFTAKVRLYLPPNFSETEKYPLLIDVYAGPDSQKITQDYKVDWGTYLSSSQGIIIGNIDGRGSGKQSTDLKFSVYRNLGSAEIEDQISVTKYLAENFGFIDANRIAIWGWSYGGYATGMVLGKDSENIFKCGISVAPVTSWLYYDTIYTERYMGLPTENDNWVNYNASSVMNHLKNFESKQFLLIHGNADDNVHYQQSMMLARAMEQADVMFSQLSYPEENHGINGPFMRRHLYHSIERFLNKECSFASGEKSRGTGTGLVMNFYLIFGTIAVILSKFNHC